MKKVVFLFFFIPFQLFTMENVLYINGATLSNQGITKPGDWDEIIISNDLECIAAIATYKGKKIIYQIVKGQEKGIKIDTTTANNSPHFMFRIKVADKNIKLICPKKIVDPSARPTYNMYKITISKLIKTCQK